MRASAHERSGLVDDFVRMCEIESPSRRERQIADALTADLEALGLIVDEDASGAETGSDAGNLLARLPGPAGSPYVLLCAHMDTVPLDASVSVRRGDGVLQNANEGILGADNKAAVAVILAALRHLVDGGPPIGVEVLFTTCEELALAGAKAFDVDRLESRFGFVFDHPSAIGELIVAAPTYYQVEARFRGAAAHAGMCPERGHNAIAAAAAAIAALSFGRLDERTTANVGLIDGGTAANVVPDRCRTVCEARSLDHERAEAITREIVDALTRAASDHSCDLDLLVEELFRGYRVRAGAAPATVAASALADVGIEAVPVSTGGGSDANAFQARGFACVNVANGTEAAHQPDERVTVDALTTMLDVVLAIVERSAQA